MTKAEAMAMGQKSFNVTGLYCFILVSMLSGFEDLAVLFSVNFSLLCVGQHQVRVRSHVLVTMKKAKPC